MRKIGWKDEDKDNVLTVVEALVSLADGTLLLRNPLLEQEVEAFWEPEGKLRVTGKKTVKRRNRSEKIVDNVGTTKQSLLKLLKKADKSLKLPPDKPETEVEQLSEILYILECLKQIGVFEEDSPLKNQGYRRFVLYLKGMDRREENLKYIESKWIEKAISRNQKLRQQVTKQGVELENNVPHPQSSRLVTLSNNVKEWFQALDYSFEDEESRNNYIEMIFRKSFSFSDPERFLLHVIEGKAEINDVHALRKSIAQKKADKGLLIANLRISNSARAEIEKIKQEEGRNYIFCYTFDELIDKELESNNFNEYFKWLETEIKNRHIDTMYIDLFCTPSDFHADDHKDNLDVCIDQWLDDDAKKHLSILGEFGTGKTWFVFHYAWELLKTYQEAQERGTKRPRLPLVIPLRDYAKAIDVGNVIAGFFFTKHKIRSNIKVFDLLNRMGKLLLLFDGFDEMAAKIDHQKMIDNFWELAKVVVANSKVILTCRTEHFPEAQKGRELLNAELKSATVNLTGERPQFEIVELKKFTEDQIRQSLSLRSDQTTVEKVMNNPALLDLACRPVMTELILEALPDIEAGKLVDISRLYLYAGRRKMENDIKSERTFTSLADKLYFLCELSWEMLFKNQMKLNYRDFPNRVRQLFGTFVQEQQDLDHWCYDLSGQTMLRRDAEGNYEPAHRSYLEFFVAYKLAAQLGVLANDFTEVAQKQVPLSNAESAHDYTWYGYFQRRVDDKGNIFPIPPLKTFEPESIEILCRDFGQAPLTKTILDLLIPMVDNTQKSIQHLLNIIEATRGKAESEIGFLGGNVITLLLKINPMALESKNLERVVIKAANFGDASLRHVNFAGANLSDSIFMKAIDNFQEVALSPDGKLLAVGNNDGTIHFLEARSGKHQAIFKAHTDMICSVAFSPNKDILASSSFDNTIKLWSFHTGECLKTFEEHTDTVRALAFSPNGEILATGSRDNTIKLWNLNTKGCLATLTEHTDDIMALAFSPDGEILATGSDDNTIKLWAINIDEDKCKCVKTLEGHKGKLISLAFSSDGKLLASGSSDNTVGLWNVSTGENQTFLKKHSDFVLSLVFIADEKILVSGGHDGRLIFWKVDTHECLNAPKEHIGCGVLSLSLHPNNQTLISGGNDATLRFWDVKERKCTKTLQGFNNTAWSVFYSPDGKLIASGGYDKRIKLWDSNTGECLSVLVGHTDKVNSVAFSPDGKFLASSGFEKIIRIWNTDTGECWKTLEGHDGNVFSVVFSPVTSNEMFLASGSLDKTIKLWNIETGKSWKTLEGHDNYIYQVACSPNGELLASGGFNKTVSLWNIKTNEHRVLSKHNSSVRSVAFNPDGTTLVSSGTDGAIYIWDVKTGKVSKSLKYNPYEGMNITGVRGLDESEKAMLKALGAIEESQ